jgi:hypothetical protein
MDWEARADLAERMWPVAASFACMVHDGDAQGVEAFLRAFDPAEADALAIVLAAMIPVDTATPADLLAWVSSPAPGPELPLEWPRDAGPQPEPERVYDPAELQAAHTRAVAAKRACRPVPADVEALDHEYYRWRRQVRAGEAGDAAA